MKSLKSLSAILVSALFISACTNTQEVELPVLEELNIEEVGDVSIKKRQYKNIEIVKPLEIEWQEKTEIGDLKFFNNVDSDNKWFDGEPHYYKVGTVKSPNEYAGDDMILLAKESWVTKPTQKAFYRFIKHKDNYILLKNYSYNAEYDPGSYSEESANIERFNSNMPNVKFSTNAIINDFEFPKTIKGENEDQVLVLDLLNNKKYPYYTSFIYGELWDQKRYSFKRDENGRLINKYIDLNKQPDLELLFTDENGLEVYRIPKFYYADWYNSSPDLFFVKSPDGVKVRYKLKNNFLDGASLITLNDGTKLSRSSYYLDLTRFGTDKYYVEIADKNRVKIDDFKIIGKNNFGENIYELKDKSHPLLSENLGYELFQVIDEETHTVLDMKFEKIELDEFIKEHQLIFWIDPFNRIITLRGSKYGPKGVGGA